MTNKILKDLRNSIDSDLRILPSRILFSIFEDKKESFIKRINFKFTNQDNILIIRQKENIHTIKFFEDKNFATNKHCDFIVLIAVSNELKIYFCEIKSSDKKIDEANMQIKSSKLFLKYLFNCYGEYFNNEHFVTINIDNISKKYYIYPKINISSKKRVCVGFLDMLPKQIKIDSNGATNTIDGYQFFKD